MSEREAGSYLVQLIEGRDVTVESYAIVDTKAEMLELTSALEQRHPSKLVQVVDLLQLSDQSKNN